MRRINPSILIFAFLLIAFSVSAQSRMDISANCKAHLHDGRGNNSIYGGASIYEDARNYTIVITWTNRTVLTYRGPKTSAGTSGQWTNTSNNQGSMALQKSSPNSFEGQFRFQNNVGRIRLYECIFIRDGGIEERRGFGVFFHNTGNINLTVFVADTDGPFAPDPTQSTVAFTGPPTWTRNSPAGLTLFGGCYSFCVHWDTGRTDRLRQKIYSYRFIGALPGRPAICLNENSPPRPIVRVSSGVPFRTGVGYDGQCPASRLAAERARQQPISPAPPRTQQTQPNNSANLPPCDCTNPRNGKRFRKPSLILGSCDSPTVLDYLTPEHYKCS
ncbi:MAG: hypothetical protein IPM25_11580 [Chloracidobacterium sp.]|nr:hypothetical protein [Chloracidobacterium sp.]